MLVAMHVYCPLSLALIRPKIITDESSNRRTDTLPDGVKGNPSFNHLKRIGGSPVATLQMILDRSPTFAVIVSGKNWASIIGATEKKKKETCSSYYNKSYKFLDIVQ